MAILIPYGASYRTIEVAQWCSPGPDPGPPGWESPGFDDSAWPILSAPFGDSSGLPPGYCPIFTSNPPASPWTLLTSRLLRTVIDFSGSITLRGAIDANISMWIDGVSVIGDFATVGCAYRDNWTVTTDFDCGEHLIAIRITDYGALGGCGGTTDGDVSYFDLIAEGTPCTPPSPETATEMWGAAHG